MNTQPPPGEHRNIYGRDACSLILPDGSVIAVGQHDEGEAFRAALYAPWIEQWKPYINQGAQDQ